MATSGIVPLSGTSVEIEGVKYSITTIPDATSKLVQDTRARVLAQMNLDDFLKDMALVGSLFYVAYNGVATQPKLRGEVSALQVKYMKLCSDSHSAMNDFQSSSELMLGYLKNFFGYLLQAEEDTALLYIGYMAKAAAKMADTATGLKEGFNLLFEQATVALAGAETSQGTEEERQKALEKERDNFEALTASALVLKEEIAKSKEKLQQLYDEAKAAAEKHEDRAFALAITGAIMKPLGEGLGAFAGAMASSKIPISLPTNPPAKSEEKEKDPPKKAEPSAEEVKAQAEAEKKRAEAEKEVKETGEAAEKAEAKAGEAKKEAAGAEEKVKAAQEKLDKAEEAEEIVAAKEKVETAKEKATEAAKAAEETTATAKEARKKADDAAEKYRLLTAAMAGLGKGLSSAGDAAMQMGKSYADIAASYNKEKQDYLKMLLDEQKQERKALADIAEYAKRIQSIGQYVDLSKIVVEALHQAVGALKQVVVILTNAAEIWKRMASHCNKLSDKSGTIRELIELWRTKPKDARIKLYLDAQFAGDAVSYYADWKALQIISNDYANAAGKIKTDVQNNVKKNVSTDEMLQVAIKEGKALLKETNQAQAGLDQEKQAIEKELTATEALTSAQTA